MIPAILLLTVLSAPAHSKPAAAPRDEPAETASKPVRQIPIDEQKTFQAYVVYTAPGYPVEVEFPEPFASNPTCGDCVTRKDLGNKKVPGLFILDVDKEQNFFTIKPRFYAGRQEDGSDVAVRDFVTPINVRLTSHLTLTVEVHYTEDRTKADARVVFVLPGRASETQYVRDAIAKAQKKMLDEQAIKIEEGVTQEFMRSLFEPHRCVPTDSRARADDVVFAVTELCRFGSSLYAHFEVSNRSKVASFVVESVEVSRGTGKSAVPLEEAHTYLPQPDAEFPKTIGGVLGWHVGEGEGSPRYTLKLIEDGGRHRTVTLDTGF